MGGEIGETCRSDEGRDRSELLHRLYEVGVEFLLNDPDNTLLGCYRLILKLKSNKHIETKITRE